MTAPTVSPGDGRFDRHALVPGWDQPRLAASRVVIVGVGALGSEVSRLLAQAGAGCLLLCDPDVVSTSNLSRGALYTAADVGRPKVAAAARALAVTAPHTTVVVRSNDLTSGVGLAELRDAAVVISCLDSLSARVRLAARCNQAGAGLLDAGTHPWGGEVRYFPAGGACFGCGLPDAMLVLRDDPYSCLAPVTVPAAGASAPTSALVGAWQATSALRLLFDLPVPAGAVEVDPAGGQSRTVVLPRDPGCVLHDPIDPDRVEPLALSVSAPVGELLAALPAGETALSWTDFPIPGHRWRRSSQLRDAPAGISLAALGVAPRELLPVVTTGDEPTVRYVELAPEPTGGEA